MSAILAIARRNHCSAPLLCCPSPLHSMQHRRHLLPPVSLARAYSSDDVPRNPTNSFWIHTLHPSRLRSSDFMDVSLKSYMTVYGPNSRSSFNGTYHGRNGFPEGTRGFLYYNSPKVGVPLAAGELRFRVTSGNTPASFVQGSDLLLESGLPWSVPLLVFADQSESVRHYQPIRQLLFDDGLITPALLETCAAMVNSNSYRPMRGSRIIHSFGQLFHITFDAYHFRFFILSMNQLRSFRSYQGLCYDSIYLTPYSGSALCCFEQSNLPQHKGTRTAVIRIVRIISPVICRYANYNGPVLLPVEGELVQRHYLHKGVQPLSFNVDHKVYMGLQTLFRDES